MHRRNHLLSSLLLVGISVVILSIMENVSPLNAAMTTPTTTTPVRISAETASRLGVFAVIPDSSSSSPLYPPYWSNDGKLLIAASYDEILLYDIPHFDAPSTRIQQTLAYSFAIDPLNRFIAWISDQNYYVHVLDIATRKEAYSLDARADTIQISPDGSLLAVRNHDTSKIIFYELTTGKKLFTIEEYAYRFIFSPDSSLFAFITARTYSVDLWTTKVKTIQRLRNIARDDVQPTNILFTSDSELLAVTYFDSHVVFWKPFTGAAERILSLSSGSEPYVTDLVFSPDNKLMATFGFGRAELWNIPTVKLISTFEDIDPDRHSGMFNSTSDLFLYGDYNDFASDIGARLRIWDVVHQRQVLIFNYEQAPRLSPNDYYLASWGENGITIWSVQ